MAIKSEDRIIVNTTEGYVMVTRANLPALYQAELVSDKDKNITNSKWRGLNRLYILFKEVLNNFIGLVKWFGWKIGICGIRANNYDIDNIQHADIKQSVDAKEGLVLQVDSEEVPAVLQSLADIEVSPDKSEETFSAVSGMPQFLESKGSSDKSDTIDSFTEGDFYEALVVSQSLESIEKSEDAASAVSVMPQFLESKGSSDKSDTIDSFTEGDFYEALVVSQSLESIEKSENAADDVSVVLQSLADIEVSPAKSEEAFSAVSVMSPFLESKGSSDKSDTIDSFTEGDSGEALVVSQSIKSIDKSEDNLLDYLNSTPPPEEKVDNEGYDMVDGYDMSDGVRSKSVSMARNLANKFRQSFSRKRPGSFTKLSSSDASVVQKVDISASDKEALPDSSVNELLAEAKSKCLYFEKVVIVTPALPFHMSKIAMKLNSILKYVHESEFNEEAKKAIYQSANQVLDYMKDNNVLSATKNKKNRMQAMLNSLTEIGDPSKDVYHNVKYSFQAVALKQRISWEDVQSLMNSVKESLRDLPSIGTYSIVTHYKFLERFYNNPVMLSEKMYYEFWSSFDVSNDDGLALALTYKSALLRNLDDEINDKPHIFMRFFLCNNAMYDGELSSDAIKFLWQNIMVLAEGAVTKYDDKIEPEIEPGEVAPETPRLSKRLSRTLSGKVASEKKEAENAEKAKKEAEREARDLRLAKNAERVAKFKMAIDRFNVWALEVTTYR